MTAMVVQTATQIDNLFRAGCLILGVGLAFYVLFRLCEFMGDRAGLAEMRHADSPKSVIRFPVERRMR